MESSGIAESTNQKKRTTWTKPAISCLLSFLINNKEELEKLNCTRGGNNHSAPLWNSASKNLEEFGHNYSSEQTFIKWKNEKSFVDVDEEKKEKKKKKNKKSGDVFEEFIEQYKEQKEKQEKERIKCEERREKLDLMLIGLLQNVVNNSFPSNNNDSMFDNYNHT